MDHCSISWSIDEAFSSRSAKNISLQRTLISEALNVAGHQNYPAGTAHGYAASIGGDVGSFHHNLLAHCEGRNWSLAGGLDAAGYFSGRMDIRHNVVYNWRGRTTDGGAHEVNFVGNYYKPGPATTQHYALIANYDNFPGTQQYFFTENIMLGYFNEVTQTSGRTAAGSNGGSVPTTYSPWVNTAFFPSYVTPQTATEALKTVLSDVGANQPLDIHDTRVLAETKAGSTTYRGSVSGLLGLPDSQADVGGWEDYGTEVRPAEVDADHDGMSAEWERAHGLNTALDDHNLDVDGDGFTALENYLNWLAGPHAKTPLNAAVEIDLRPYLQGLNGIPSINVSAATHGSVSMLGDGATARFTPAVGFTGVATFSFAGSDGLSVSRAMQILVTVPEYRLEASVLNATTFTFSTSLQTYLGQQYQLQTTANLEQGPWLNVGAAQAGTGGTLMFLDGTPGLAGRKFYRIKVLW
jgi:hypothetical protein